MAGTARNTVARSAAMVAHTASGSKRLCSTARPPASRLAPTPPSPCWWNSGRPCTSTSSPVQRQARSTARMFESTLAWSSGTPLGRPVVPDV